MTVWPPWVLRPSGITFVRSADGLLKRVTRVDNRLAVTIECGGREGVGHLEWDPPPSVTAVEKVLRAHLGEPITALGYLDVR